MGIANSSLFSTLHDQALSALPRFHYLLTKQLSLLELLLSARSNCLALSQHYRLRLDLRQSYELIHQFLPQAERTGGKEKVSSVIVLYRLT